MTDEAERVIAWGEELRRVHATVRRAMEVARDALAQGGSAEQASRELLLYCYGFCAALTGHHRSEDATLFPLLTRQRPDLAPVVDKLTQDHSMIDYLVTAFEHAITAGIGEQDAHRHLDGIEAVMESHFRYEERALVVALNEVDAPTLRARDLFGPLAD